SGVKRRPYTQPGCDGVTPLTGFRFGLTHSRTNAPSATFQIFTVLSQLPVASRVPSGLNATVNTLSRCPLSASFSLYGLISRTSVPAFGSQLFTVWSRLPDASSLPSGLHATV